jgi:SulP family sulfate permease
VLDRLGAHPKVYIFDLSEVPLADSTAAVLLRSFVHKAKRAGAEVYLAGVRAEVLRVLIPEGLREPLVTYVTDAASASEAAHAAIAAAA